MYLLAIISSVWAFSYGLIKEHLTSLSPDFVAWARLVIPFLLFFPLFQYKKLSIALSARLIFIGAVQYGLMYIFVIRAYHYLPAHQVALFTAFTPIYVILFDSIFSKKIDLLLCIPPILALLSIWLLYGNFSSIDSLSYKGIVLVQASDLCFALGQILYKRLPLEALHIKDKTIYMLPFLGGCLVTTLSTSIFGQWELLRISTSQIITLLYLGAIASGLCFFLWNSVAKKISSSTLAVFNNLKLPLGVLVSITFFHEKADFIPLMGSLGVIILAIFFSNRFDRNMLELKKSASQ